MGDSARASKRSKHKVFWKDVLSLQFRKDPTNHEQMIQSPVMSDRTSPNSRVDAHQPSPTLVRSNARAKALNPQSQKPARINGRHAKSSRKHVPGNIGATTPARTGGDMAVNLDSKIPLPSPPPYVLSLPEAVVTPPSLVALTNDELRSRGIYSPHPATDHCAFRTPSGLPRSSMSRNTSFRSVLSILAPRLGLRSTTVSRSSPRAGDHVRHQSLLSSTVLAIGICISVLMISLDRTSIVTAIPSVLADFKSFEEMGWYGSAYLLTAAAFQPMYGRIYTSFNIKWSFLAAVVIFKVGALVSAIAPTSTAFVLGRALQGLGSAGISTGSSAIVIHNFSPEVQPMLLGLLDVLAWAGTIAGPVLGAAFSQLLSWKWCYYLNVVLAVTTFACVVFSKSYRLRTPRPNLIHQASDFSSTGKTFARRVLALDWIGNLMFMAACTFLFLTLQLSQRKEFDWSSPPWIIFTSLSVTTMVLCVLWMQLRGDNALIPFHILRQRTVAASCGTAFFLHGAFTIHIYYLPIWFQAIKKEDAIRSGVAMLPYLLIMALLSLVASRYIFRNGHFALSTTFGCGIATIGAGLIIVLDSEVSMFACAGFQIVMAAGLGIALQRSLSAVQAVLPPHEVSIGTAAVVAYQNAGGAIFVSVGDTLFQKYLRSGNSSGIDLKVIMEFGMTETSTRISSEAYSAILKLYSHALRTVFIAVIPLCGIAFLISLCMEWNIIHDDHDVQVPRLMNMQGFNRGLSSPELGSDAPTLAHLAPRARQRWSQRGSGPMTDVEGGRMRLTTVLQESNESQTSLSSVDDAVDADIKEIEIGVAH